MNARDEASNSRRWLGAAIFGAALAAAALVAWVATRKPAPAASADAHAGHTVPEVLSDSARAISLSRVDAERIGVTYAPVTFEPVGKDVRAGNQS